MVRNSSQVRHFSSYLRLCQQQKNLETRVISRILKPANSTDNNEARSGWKLWAGHLFKTKKETFDKLKMLQSRIMGDIEIAGHSSNKILFDEINQWHFHNNLAKKVRTPTVLIHGYAATSTAFFRSIPYLNRDIKDLYTIDLPGNGLSFTPSLDLEVSKPLPLKIENIDDGNEFQLPYVIDSAHHRYVLQKLLDYYVDRIEQWRLDNKLGKINVVAHSYGGYLSFNYALKYPANINTLGLISPLGVERNIYSINNEFHSRTIYKREWNDCNSMFYDRKFKLNDYLFQKQLKPLRWLGPIGAKLCWNYIRSAYARVPSIDYKDYTFETFYGRGGLPEQTSQIFTSLFTSSLLARDPLLDHVSQLQVPKLIMMYGQYDWMNKNGGKLMTQIFNGETKYIDIPNAGHNLFLDNPSDFASQLTTFLAD
ncbi:Protein ECM18 [Nakaseomyces glabratus]|uniref:Protein ECM18 n=1 Tax=Candida glabrata TaxID=5478 RepID=A0A0W0D1B3_CANGB|nr:alpha/beta hydrolase fold [Nakaseomyces glabratus]KAH7609962.1 alpha/beta hydrolase fold [Nakaseomyces glabratus]KAI8390457.1 alpha/beta hydrolase fold [Nakaseomyces glabratus]KAI8400816.1 alpha/beta hydrolase fold [Nakaseomyces glabratus]KTB03890.1 Protein ECM18 [Nakaseomyces glabratus]